MPIAAGADTIASGRIWSAARCTRFALMALGVLWLAGCSRDPMPHAAGPRASQLKAPQTKAPSSDTRQDADADLVSAVGSATSNSPISVKFRIGKRPQLGVPLPILVAVIPSPEAQISHLHGSFLPDSGLSLQGDRVFDVGELHAGEPLERELTVVPQAPGVLNLNATFTFDLDSGSVSLSYTIPVIVADNSS